MKLGFLTTCLPQLLLENILHWTAVSGFKALELAAWPVESDGNYQGNQVNARQVIQRKIDELKAALATHDLTEQFTSKNLTISEGKFKIWLEYREVKVFL